MTQASLSVADDTVLIGEIKSAYGIKGWLWVYSYTEPKENIFTYTPWFYRLGSGFQVLTFDSWRNQASGLVVKLCSVDDRTVAQTYTGTKLWVAKCTLPAPEEGEFYVSDLVGMQAVLESGALLGTVAEVIDNVAHPIVKVVASVDSVDTQTRLIPWHQSTVIHVDKEQRRIVFDWQLDY